MAITRKPQRTVSPSVDIDALIGRGGSPGIAAAEPEEKPAVVPLLIRIPSDMLSQVEAAVKARPFRTPRHTWILEAIHEKLEREIPPSNVKQA